MYTQCPKCNTVYRVTIEQLRGGRGEVVCQECKVAFNALTALSEKPKASRQGEASVDRIPVLSAMDSVAPKPLRPLVADLADADGPTRMRASTVRKAQRPIDWSPEDEPLPDASASVIGYLAWGLCSFLLAGMLVVQVFVFEGQQLVQNPQARPWLDMACETLGCALPDFRASSDIQVINRNLRPTADDTDALEFNLVIANQSPLPQAFPDIKLRLTGDGGGTLQSRIFTPKEYLGDDTVKLMPVGKPFQIRLLLAKPEPEVAGFSFDLI
jgi:predicted Zn finger-like uncharacterized protein